MLGESGRSAVLQAKCGGLEYLAWFVEGALVDAQCEALFGADAIYAFATERRGTYEVSFKDVRRTRVIDRDLESLISRVSTGSILNQLREMLPPGDAILRPRRR